MTTWPDRPHTALLVVDVQNGVVVEAHDRDAVVGKVAALVARARHEQVPVVWVQQTDDEFPRGSDTWGVVPELDPADHEPRIEKEHGDSFEATELAEVLAGLGVGRVVVAGAQTDACIRATLHGAFVRGYDTVLVTDAHTTEDLTAYGAPPPPQVIAHTNLYWGFQSGPGRTATTATAAEVDLTGARAGEGTGGLRPWSAQ
ncbi:isochorismatase family protein [Pseudonocardia abyssalis]|uniref:Isochorismatase family protein n=1 Tax=Pseudonocardia abyssalis TaxID=2792008 RepID=A0ABS6UW44_9PSEU|nr:isochorismatase family protein [Pseudonocardia abyssalis]MBW0117644.1 isochorismatase family protein [Pseudonocardia abyssalis]MBW0136490.1 isochorismatase family protein [Pseudonocardia abyssalis]